MNSLTAQEKLIIKFLSGAIAVGALVGIIRHYFYSDQELIESVNNQIEEFSKMSEVPINNVDSLMAEIIPGEGNSGQVNELISINNASKEELMMLPKIGPVTAERIIRFREDFGNFQNIDELKNIKGIGPKTMEQLRLLVTL
ncbi:MAG: helix-hairpin-helix domain-containing protein [Candidatus Marinimicrobia bacterium]|nr:helix-hairpin-helix domain-containing protein [Candidatus Neomarinimicrobiota bacterium]